MDQKLVVNIWKVSHSPIFFSEDHLKWLEENKYVCVNENTGNGGAENFKSKMKVGDIVSLGYGNSIAKLVRVSSGVVTDELSPLVADWSLRRYTEIKSLSAPKKYEGPDKGWAPARPNTCYSVPAKELNLFESAILKKYYNLELSDLQHKEQSLDIMSEHETHQKNSPLNQILYGPPGTGKTYSTINKALEILDPECLYKNSDNRYILKARFDELLHNNRIGFVTFHQSFSYEDFVEGIKADTEDGKVHYSIEDGIFKAICEQAASSVGDEVLLDAFDTAVQALQERCEEAEERIVMETVRGKKFEIEFIGGSTFKVFPYSTERTDPKYVASIPNVRKLYLTGSKKGIYNTSYVEGFLLYLKQHLDLEESVEEENRPETESQQFVLIIDEINRGNIANIFGELITLIEPSKRAGGSESLTVKLPYSKKPFSVPSNLHIIGTMNTADKSLAQVDIALRRRFEFIEMMPDYSVLEDIPDIDGINIRQLLETINQRIELLYDREHMIGHSFFLPLIETPTMANLTHIFELQILPLLEEYFFEDWERVGQVLGDHLKTNQLLCFIIEKFDSNAVMKLMGNDWEQTGIQPYQRNHQALTDPQAYIGIYDAITDA